MLIDKQTDGRTDMIHTLSSKSFFSCKIHLIIIIVIVIIVVVIVVVMIMYTLIRTALTHVRNIPCVFINKPHNTNRFTASSQCDTFLDLSQQKGFIGDVNIGTEHGKGDVVQERGEAFDSYVKIVHPEGLNLVQNVKID